VLHVLGAVAVVYVLRHELLEPVRALVVYSYVALDDVLLLGREAHVDLHADLDAPEALAGPTLLEDRDEVQRIAVRYVDFACHVGYRDDLPLVEVRGDFPRRQRVVLVHLLPF
jgi:hypothetical protein